MTGRTSTARTAPASPPPRIVVRRGDSLWAIATQLLPPDASVADIASLTNRLYRVNASTIGLDPDLIIPGMILNPPKGTP